MNKIRVMLCDDQKDILDYFDDIISSQPDMEVIGKAKNKEEAVSLAKEKLPDIVLMDIQLCKECEGIDAIKEITALEKNIKCIVLTVHKTDEIIVDAFLAGAVEYIIKTEEKNVFLKSLREVYSNDSYMSALIKTRLGSEITRMRTQEKSMLFIINELSSLTATELSILKSVYKGNTYEDVALENFIELCTVKFHMSNIFKKLGVKNRKQLILKLKETNVLELGFFKNM